MKPNPKQVKQEKKGFEEVEKIHPEELRCKTPDPVMAEIETLFMSGQLFGGDRRSQRQEYKRFIEKWGNWIKLKQLYASGKWDGGKRLLSSPSKQKAVTKWRRTKSAK